MKRKSKIIKFLFSITLFMILSIIPNVRTYAWDDGPSKNEPIGQTEVFKAKKYSEESSTRYTSSIGKVNPILLDDTRTTKTILWTTDRISSIGSKKDFSIFSVALYDGSGCSEAENWYTKFSDIDPNNSNS